jgi:hypothetical protein
MFLYRLSAVSVKTVHYFDFHTVFCVSQNSAVFAVLTDYRQHPSSPSS